MTRPANSPVAIPADVYTHTCRACGAPAAPDPNLPVQVSDRTGKAFLSLLCTRQCGGWDGAGYSWLVTDDEYRAVHGTSSPWHPVPVEQRVLPPGPWGVTGVPATDVPADAWEQTCPNQDPYAGGPCGAALVPDPKSVFYYDEFTSTAVMGMACRGTCRYVFVHYTWQLTAEQHHAVFGRSLEEFAPKEIDPDDFDDDDVPDEIAYSIWRTSDRAYYQEFYTLADLIGGTDYDLRAFEAGEFTVKHWASGAVWDMPEFVADHAATIAAEYDEDDESTDDPDDDTYDGFEEDPCC